MRLHELTRPLLVATLAAAPLFALAQEQKPANEQVIVPQVERREVKLPHFPSNDFELGLFAGTYATQNYGSSLVKGVRLGYHITEDFFVEGVYARTKVNDDLQRQVFFASAFSTPNPTLAYYNVSIGYNVLPGEVFIGKNTALASALYLIGGIGSTKLDTRRSQTFNFGFGTRVFLADWAALQVDLRDHVFSLDLLGKRQNTKNLELTAGLTFFF